MKTSVRFFLFLLVASSLACQFLDPSRPGTVISECSAIVLQVSKLQVGEFPEYLLTPGKKSRDEFDVDQYFNVLTLHIRSGTVISWIMSIKSTASADIRCCMPVLWIRLLMLQCSRFP